MAVSINSTSQNANLQTPSSPHGANINRLTEEVASFISSGVSITASSRDSRFIPSISRVLGCTTNSQGSLVRIFLVKSQALQLLRDVAATAEIAIVFSKPSSHKTLQLKGKDAHQSAILDSDLILIEGSLKGFSDDIFSLGYSREFAQAFHHYSLTDLTAISFTPAAIYEQSPGPDAGKALEFSR
jgi:hypothetical protein